MDTLVPGTPLKGENVVMVMDPPVLVTVKKAVLRTVPAGATTVIGPLIAPAGTVAFMEVDVTTEKTEATPLKSTLVAPTKLVPDMPTLDATGPLVGEKPVMVMDPPVLVTVKKPLLRAVLVGEMTLMGPVVAPAGTVALIELDVTT